MVEKRDAPDNGCGVASPTNGNVENVSDATTTATTSSANGGGNVVVSPRKAPPTVMVMSASDSVVVVTPVTPELPPRRLRSTTNNNHHHHNNKNNHTMPRAKDSRSNSTAACTASITSRSGFGQRLREAMVSPGGLKRHDSVALLKQPVVSLFVAGRRIARSRSVSKVSWSLLRAGDKGSRSSVSGGSEDGQSNSHSSDYEDQDDIERTGSASLVGRMRGLRRDMQKKISRLKSPRGSTSSSPGHMAVGGGLPSTGGDEKGTPPHLSTSPVDALPSTGPLGQTASGSNRSSLSGGEEAETYTGPFIGRARALVDYQPSPYDRDAIKFKKGDVIDIIAKNPSGLWKGCVGGRVGHFKFILVEEEIEQQRAPRRSRVSSSRGTTRRGRSRTLEELLARLRLSHLVQVFVLNGYEDLEQFREVEAEDLDCLGITDPETRAKLLTAVALLHDADSDPEDIQSSHHAESGGAIHRGDHGRDSGCYTDHRSAPAPPPPAPSLGMGDENNLDTRQSTPSTDTSSGYHSRGAYNIPMGESGGGSSTLPRDDGEGLQDSSPPPPPPAPSGSVEPNSGAGSSAPSTPRSYRAQLATVLPASPRPSRYEQQQFH